MRPRESSDAGSLKVKRPGRMQVAPSPRLSPVGSLVLNVLYPEGLRCNLHTSKPMEISLITYYLDSSILSNACETVGCCFSFISGTYIREVFFIDRYLSAFFLIMGGFRKKC